MCLVLPPNTSGRWAGKSYPFGGGRFEHIIYNEHMKPTIRLNTKVLPIISAFALLMQIIDPSRAWVILLIGIGGAWLVCAAIWRGAIRYGTCPQASIWS